MFLDNERHFKTVQEPFLCLFEILFLTGQFEEEIFDFFSRIECLRCHALHIGLTFSVSSLFAVPKNVPSLQSNEY